LYLYYHYAKKVLDVRHLIHMLFFLPNQTRLVFTEKSRLPVLLQSRPHGSNSTYDKRGLSLSSEEVARRVRAGAKSVVLWNVGAPVRKKKPNAHVSSSETRPSRS